MSIQETRGAIHSSLRLLLPVMLVLMSGLLAPTPAHARPLSPRFTRLTTDHGLSHNIVWCIAQDREGFLWFGTQDGLNRYDGYSFTVYRHRRSDPASLANNVVQTLCVDAAGTLWVGTAGGLDSYTGVAGRFVHHTAIPAESVRALYADAAGVLWVGTEGAGLFRYDPATGQATPYQPDPADPGSLSHNWVTALYQDRAGTLWVGTAYGGLNALDRATGRFTRYQHDPARPDSLSAGHVTTICEDRAGTLWVGTGFPNETQPGGLDALDRATGCFIHYRHDPADRHSLSHDCVQAVCEDQAGRLWIGTAAGLNILEDGAAGRFTRYRPDPLDPHSLSEASITAIYEDRAGALWLATQGGGVNQYARAKDKFPRYQHDPLEPNSLSAPKVGALCAGPAHILWIGLHNGGLDRLDRATGQFTHYAHDPADPGSLGHDHVTALCVDHAGTLWVGHSRGLDRLDPASGRFTHYVHDPEDPRSIGPGAVKVIREDRAQSLWIGTEDPGTLTRFDPAAGTFACYQYDPANPTGLIHTYGIRAICQDRAGDLWLGTYNGLVHFDPQTATFTAYRHDPTDPASLSHDFVWCIHQDRAGVLWIGTQAGLNRLDLTTQRFTIYTVEDGLPNDAVIAILGDEQDNLWLATIGGGLSRFDPRAGTFRNYDVRDGLQSNQFIIGAYSQSQEGEILLGGPNGFNAFFPAQIQDNPHVPPVVLTAFRQFDQVVTFDTPLADVREITLSYQDSFFAFEFAALDYTDPARNQYAYRLDGFDPDWVYCGPRRYAAYTNVPPGTYTFRVKGSNNDGIWNEEGLAVRLVITPPFWETAWFRLLVVAALTLIGAAVYTVRARNIAALRAREERFRALFENAPLGVLEVDVTGASPRILRANQQSETIYGWSPAELASGSLERVLPAEAGPELARLAERLWAGETVRLEATHIRRDGHAFPVRLSAAPLRAPGRRPVAIVVVEDITAEKAWRTEEEAIAEERRRIAREIHDGLAQDLVSLRMRARLWHQVVDEAPQQMHAEIDALRDLLRQNIREVRRAILALRPAALDELGFYPALRQFVEEFREQSQVHVDLRIVGPPERLPTSLEPVLFRIVQEALHNVDKHAQAQTVWIELRLDEAEVALTIRDDGVGFDPAGLEEKVRRGHVGLKQMRERVAGLKGTFALHTVPGQGTEIRISLPVAKNTIHEGHDPRRTRRARRTRSTKDTKGTKDMKGKEDTKHEGTLGCERVYR